MTLAVAVAAVFAACEDKQPASTGGKPGLTSPGAAAQPRAAPEPEPGAAPTKPGAWPTYEGPGFTVTHPRQPRTQTTDVPTEAGTMAMTAYTFQAPGSDVASAVMATRLPAVAKGVDPAAMIRDARDGMVNKYGAKLDKDREVKIGAVPGLDFAAHGDHPQLGAFFLRGRVAIHADQLFQVIVIGAGHAEIPEAGRFVESFALR